MRICITIKTREREYLSRLSKALGLSQAAIVRMALNDYFSNYLIDNKKKK